MKIGQKIYTIFGWVTLKGKKHSPIGNKVLWYGIDEQGKVHNIEDKILAEEPDDTAKVEKDNREKATKKTASDISNLAKKDFNVSVKNFPEAEKLSGVLSDIKNAQEATTGAVKAIPKTIIPEIKIPDNKELYELWKDELLESLKIEIPKVDLEPVITAINKIKIPAIPKANDYTQLLKDIKKALPKEQDDSAIIEAIKNIPEFEIPEKFIIKDSIKVAVDRVAGGGGSGVGGLNTLQEGYLKTMADNQATEDKQDDIIANQLSQLMVRIATNSSDGSITYVGRAPIGSATSSGVWQITKYDESVSEVSKFAGDGKYNQIFNSRESLSYE